MRPPTGKGLLPLRKCSICVPAELICPLSNHTPPRIMTLLLRLFLISAICLQSNALTTLIPTYNLTSLITESLYECIPKPSFFTRIPKFTDCVDAIIQLPRIDGGGSFHNGAPDDPYRLPVKKTSGTCTVSVELEHEGSTREAGDWFFMVDAMLSVARRCLNLERAAGARVWCGRHFRILVTVGTTELSMTG